jgi:NAD(P)-dependent dehydrogenase (short-subunit alcohol dehydrogenase family)
VDEGRTSQEVVFVTGAASGIGAGVARLLAERGDLVVLADRDGRGAEAGAAELTAQGLAAVAVTVDVTEPEALRDAFARLDDEGRFATGLVSCAGLNRRAAFLDVDPDDLALVLDVNLRGTLYAGQAFARRLVAADRPGAIVNVTSMLAHFGAPNLSSYAASKGGVAMLTRVMATELTPHGIRVNAVSPGYIETALTRRMFSIDAYRGAILARTPAGRLGNPEDVARVVSFLLSEDARFVSGQILPIDGGLTAGDAALGPPDDADLERLVPTGQGAPR